MSSVTSPNSEADEVPLWPEEDYSLTTEHRGGFYPARLGETLDDHYVLTRKLGYGGFSSVWLARDIREQKHVSIKILSAYATELAESNQLAEIDIFATLQRKSTTSPLGPGLGYVVRPLDIFTFDSSAGKHSCIATEPFGYSLLALFDVMNSRKLPLLRIMKWLKDTLLGLRFLHDQCRVIHSDLKPQNFLMKIREPDYVINHELVTRPAVIYEAPKTAPPLEVGYCPVKSLPLPLVIDGDMREMLFETVISDFGHAHFDDQHLSKIVQPSALRAPEVALGLTWDKAIDIWSLGCLMYEFATGAWLFFPEDVSETEALRNRLTQITQRTGETIPQHMLEASPYTKDWTDLNAGDIKPLRPIEENISPSTILHHSVKEFAPFISTMKAFLRVNPAERPTASQALQQIEWDIWEQGFLPPSPHPDRPETDRK